MHVETLKLTVMEMAKQLCERQLANCQLLVEKYPKIELIEKALSAVQSSLKKLASASAEEDSQDGGGKVFDDILSNFTQSCLDSTYHQECQLVDKEFPDHISNTEVQQIVETLSRPLTFCKLLGSEFSRLGSEVMECLHWRVGALLYMYSHMVLTVEERKKRVDVEHFKEVLCVGVGHLNLMLCTRAPLGKDEDYVAKDATVVALLEQGIFSDLHMLSLMYAGEMCHWYWELCSTADAPKATAPTSSELESNGTKHSECSPEDVTPKDKSSASNMSEDKQCSSEHLLWCVMELTQGVRNSKQWNTNFNPQKYGVEFLSKYVDVARGPLKAQNWNYVKAVQLLVSLRKSGSQS